ncbi:hypothetical protein ACF1HJ_01275 [Streptomyces sp. NPDC013978]|uniref:hypothetical protein n=1 Tax=Streptomyces sp. NPDC013978 TaxID=3364869 RepID=UPI0036F65D72
MTTKTMSAVAVADRVRSKVAVIASELAAEGGPVRLIVISTADRSATSRLRHFTALADSSNIGVDVLDLGASADRHIVVSALHSLETDPRIHGVVLFGRPAPEPPTAVDDTIALFEEARTDRLKDVASTAGVPVTVLALQLVLDHCGLDLRGKDIVLATRSRILDEHMPHVLERQGATVRLDTGWSADRHPRAEGVDVLIRTEGSKADPSLNPGAVVLDASTHALGAGPTVAASADVFPQAAAVFPFCEAAEPVIQALLLRNAVHAAAPHLPCCNCI